MPRRPVSLHAQRDAVAAAEIAAAIDALLEDKGEEVPLEFPAEVLAAAEAAAAAQLREEGRVDLTDLPFVTLDPASSTDLDQAMLLERDGEGFRVRYAIADVPAFVQLNDPIDQEARRRGTTVYLPDRRIPLHPPVLSEGRASLLPDQVAPAFVWTMSLDAAGAVTAVDLERALVRSTQKLAYDEVQREIDAGTPHPMMALLLEIGQLRAQQEEQRGGASLNVPEQEVVVEDEHVRLTWRSPAPIEDANAHVSLMTGMAAADLMLAKGVGILRTMPPAEPRAVTRFRHQSRVLGIPWEKDVPYGEFLRSLDWREGTHLALLNHAASLFRGASYAAFTTPEEIPEHPAQAAIAAPYAHTTAPLRRLVDRFVLLVCHAHARDEQPSSALVEALRVIPEAMASTAGRAGVLEREARALVECAALQHRVGEEFTGTVIERREASVAKDGSEGAPTRVEVQLLEPPMTAWVPMDAQPGQEVRVRLDRVDTAARRSVFLPAAQSGA